MFGILGACLSICFGVRFQLFIEVSLKIRFPTTWTDGKAEVGRLREEKGRRAKIRKVKE
jgi:hypothetical protein